MRARDLWSSSNRIEENLFTGLQVNTIVMALMWRIDRGDWPYYWICCCCLTKLTHMGERLKSESTLHSRGWQDSVTDVVIMMFMLESFCLFWIIIPVAWHPVWLWPGGTPVSDLMWNSVLWFVEPDHRHHSVSRSTSPQSPNAGPSSHTWGQYLAGDDDYNLFWSPPPQAFFVQTTGCQLFPHKLMIAQFRHPLHWKLDQRFLRFSSNRLEALIMQSLFLNLKYCTFTGHTDQETAKHLTKVLCLMPASQWLPGMRFA